MAKGGEEIFKNNVAAGFAADREKFSDLQLFGAT
jgi:hypothetical protein